VDGVRFCLHIGVGCGNVNILQVGGIVPPETHVPRSEYIIAGPPLEQISIAEPLAKNGQTCFSPQAWEHIRDCVIEGSPLEDRPDFHLLLRMDESKYTFPTIKHAAMENDNRAEKQFRLTELNVIRRYIPSAVFKQIECGTLTYVNEMRNISTIFISASGGLDVMTDRGAAIAQDLMASVQRKVYQHEGTLNKFLIDDKGMLFLLVFGLPPLVHTDDPTRAVLACFDMVKVFAKLELIGRFGVTTGKSYCGICGSPNRMEYTVLGDCVNLAARLMSQATKQSILCDEVTKDRSTSANTEVIFNALAPIKVKGKANVINVYQPVKKDAAAHIGVTAERKIRFPWHDHPFGGSMTTGGSHATTSQQSLVYLCGVKTWEGIAKVTEMLGSPFHKQLHFSEQVLAVQAPTAVAPQGSPFSDGGVLVLEGPTGMGKTELAEHIVVHTSMRLQMMPVFGTMGPRPGDSRRLAVSLLRSTLGVFRMIQDLPSDDYQALEKLTPGEHSSKLGILRSALYDHLTREKSSDILDTAIDIFIGLMGILVKQFAVSLVLQFEYGTSLFPKALQDQTIFWKAVERLSPLVLNKTTKPFVMILLCCNADKTNPVVQLAEEKNTFLHLSGLTEENILMYMGNYLSVPTEMVPPALRQFVAKVTLGNPLYIRETIDQLQENNIQVNFGANKQPKGMECKDIDKVNLAAWSSTAMVGGTVCLLESLDPLEAAVLKMSTCFQGTFTLPDLAASTCSRWADATHFDFLRLLKAIRKLIQEGIIEVIDSKENHQREKRNGFFEGQKFQTKNLLIRAVGGAMVLEAQKKSVKRQALIDRALSKELPGRMEVLASKRNQQHIPWYYEQAFRRM